MAGFFSKLVRGDRKASDRESRVRARMEVLSKEDDAGLAAYTQAFRERVRAGTPVADFADEALAVCAEAIRRRWDDVATLAQLEAAVHMHAGRVVDMPRGTGRSNALLLAAYLGALDGRGVLVAYVTRRAARRAWSRGDGVLTMVGVTSAYREKGVFAEGTDVVCARLGGDCVFSWQAQQLASSAHDAGDMLLLVDELDAQLVGGSRFWWSTVQPLEGKDGAVWCAVSEGELVPGRQVAEASMTLRSFVKSFGRVGGLSTVASEFADSLRETYSLSVERVGRWPSPSVKEAVFASDQGRTNALLREVANNCVARSATLVLAADKQTALSVSDAFRVAGIKHSMALQGKAEESADVIEMVGRPAAVTIVSGLVDAGVGETLSESDISSLRPFKVYQLGTSNMAALDAWACGLAAYPDMEGAPEVFRWHSFEDGSLSSYLNVDAVTGMMKRVDWPDDVPVDSKMLLRSLDMALAKRDATIRATDRLGHRLDAVVERHWNEVLDLREAARTTDVQVLVDDAIADAVRRAVERFDLGGGADASWDLPGLRTWATRISQEASAPMLEQSMPRSALEYALREYLSARAQARIRKMGEAASRNITVLRLTAIGAAWAAYLQAMSYSVNAWGKTEEDLKSYERQDTACYETMRRRADEGFLRLLLWREQQTPARQAEGAHDAATPSSSVKSQVGTPSQEAVPSPAVATPQVGAPSQNVVAASATAVPQQPGPRAGSAGSPILTSGHGDITAAMRETTGPGAESPILTVGVGRNDPCPCGSGKRFKDCHGRRS